ncbi:MAG: NAD-dependent epimerase/dehydratase family protein [Alphaproteobacteria bacterium GM202ARS2]|nr:NAD-dependent epimerase/dehydratase family protein [Alphaproteobacteria bacterium GM202ARS2]
MTLTLANKTAFVTGGAGFVGSAVVRALLQQGCAVRALLRQPTLPPNLHGLDIEPIHADLLSCDYQKALRGCHAVFHVAADYRLWAKDPHQLYRTNVDGTRRLMLACLQANIERIVYTSSVATLGNVPGGAADEETPVTYDAMIGDYKKSKFLAESVVAQLALSESLPVVITNPSAPIGPRDIRPTPTGRMIVEAAAGRVPVYVDSGLNVVHVDDVAEGHLLAYKKGTLGRRYILGGDNLRLKAIFHTAAKLNGKRPPLMPIPRAPLVPFAYLSEFIAQWRKDGYEPLLTVSGIKLAKKRMFFSSKRAQKELDYQPKPAHTAIQDAVTWFKENGYL